MNVETEGYTGLVVYRYVFKPHYGNGGPPVFPRPTLITRQCKILSGQKPVKPVSANDTVDLPRPTLQPHPSSRQMKEVRVEDRWMSETDRPVMASGWAKTVTT